MEKKLEKVHSHPHGEKTLKEMVDLLVVVACAVEDSHRTAAFVGFRPCGAEVAFEVQDCLDRVHTGNLELVAGETAHSNQIVVGSTVDDSLVQATEH